MNIEPLRALMLNDNGFAFQPTTGESFQCSETGVAVIKHLLHGISEDHLAFQLADEFDIDLALAEHDIDEFMLTLKSMGLLTA